LDILNESRFSLKNQRIDHDEAMTKCIKKMESVLQNGDMMSQTSTSSSRKSSVVNVLISFSENYFIPFYGHILGMFLLIMIGSITAYTAG
jgi:hypothetical protein